MKNGVAKRLKYYDIYLVIFKSTNLRVYGMEFLGNIENNIKKTNECLKFTHSR